MSYVPKDPIEIEFQLPSLPKLVILAMYPDAFDILLALSYWKKLSQERVFTFAVSYLEDIKIVEIKASFVKEIYTKIQESLNIYLNFRIDYWDNEFQEYVELENINELESKAKLRCVELTYFKWGFSHTFLACSGWQSHGGNIAPYKTFLLKDEFQIYNDTEYKYLLNLFDEMHGGDQLQITKAFAIHNDASSASFETYMSSLTEKFRLYH